MKVIIIGGSGHWHFVSDAMPSHPEIEAVAIAPGSIDENMENAYKAFPDAVHYADWKEMVDSVAADYAIVNPHFYLTAQISAYCLSKDMNVYSEKPLATDLKQLEMLKKAIAASKGKLGGMFNYRFTPWFQGLSELVKNGEIGTLRQIHAIKSYRLGTRAPFYSKRETFGGLIPWVAIHAIDWVDAFMGECTGVSALHSDKYNGDNGTMEISSAVLMQMENGGIATVTADFFRPTGSARHDDDRMRITGTRGMAEVIDGVVTYENENKKRVYALPEAKNAFIEFVNAVNEGRADEFTVPSLNATLIALKARESADNNGAFIKL